MKLNSLLFLICSLAGLLLVSGSLYLLWKGIIDFKEGQGVTEMEMPGGAKIKTPVPALVMFVLGVLMVVFPVYKRPELEIVKLRGVVATDADVEVHAVVDQREAHASNAFDLAVPYLPDHRYFVRYLDKSGAELDKESFMLGPGEMVHELRGMKLKGAVPAAAPAAAAPIQVTQTESSATVAEFKAR
jgi:hypothetical protein